MPTILRIRGLQVTIYPNDHPPAHVHVMGRGCEARFALNCPNGPVSLMDNFDFSDRELRQIMEELTAHLTELCEAWRKIHGF